MECPHCNKPIILNATKTELRKSEKVPLIEMVQSAAKKWKDDIDILKDGSDVVVIPNAYLGDTWHKLSDALKSFNPEWVSEGKESRWVIKARA